MSDKQKGEFGSKPVAYDQLLSHLLHVGETLLGETQGVFDRLSQEIALVTHEQVQLILQQETSEQPPPPQPRFRFLVFFKNRFYGALMIEPDPANPVSPVIPFETASMLTQACGWLLYTIEVTALLPELRQPNTRAYRAPTSLSERERDILALMCQGYTTEGTATMLDIAQSTVRKHREHLYAEFGTHSVGETIFVAFASGLFYPIDDVHPRIMSSGPLANPNGTHQD